MTPRRSFFVLLLCCSISCLAADQFAVTAKIVATGTTSRGREACIVEAEVRNQSPFAETLAMMSCRWDSSWRVEPSTVFAIVGPECSANVPVGFAFPSGGGFRFRFRVEASKAGAVIVGQNFTLGLIAVKWRRNSALDSTDFRAMRSDPNALVIGPTELRVPKLGADDVDIPQEMITLPATAATIAFAATNSTESMFGHRTYLRGIVNVPALQAALFEITDAIPNLGVGLNEYPRTWLAGAGEQFEARTIRGEQIRFELLDVDFPREIVKTREAGEEHKYSFVTNGGSKDSKASLHLRDASFKDVITVYSTLTGRTILLHPSVDRSPFTLEAIWANKAPDKVEITVAFAKSLDQRGAVALEDGDRFLQIVPSAMRQLVSLRSKDLPSAPPDRTYSFTHVALTTLVRLYSNVSGRPVKDIDLAAGKTGDLRTPQRLSKPEALYALETVFLWNDLAIQMDTNATWHVVQVSRQLNPRP